MKIWTIQPVELYESLIENKVLHCDMTKSNWLQDSLKDKAIYGNGTWTFKDSYDWMVEQMDKKGIARSDGVQYPWWGWYSYEGKNKKPDLRTIGLGNTGELSVCIELEIPDNEVLLSDHDNWHCILNNSDIWDWNDNADYMEEFDRYEQFRKYMNSKEFEEYKHNSWNKIFDVADSDIKYVQCTFWELRLENVRKVQEFKCR